jgi:hypothetical protein
MQCDHSLKTRCHRKRKREREKKKCTCGTVRCLLFTVIISGSDKTKNVRLQEAAHWKASRIFSTYGYTCTRRGASVTALLHSELGPIEKQFAAYTENRKKNLLNRHGSDEPAICRRQHKTPDNKVNRLVPKKSYSIYSLSTMWSLSKYIPCACTHLLQRCC